MELRSLEAFVKKIMGRRDNVHMGAPNREKSFMRSGF